MDVVVLRHISKSYGYGRESVTVLQNIGLTIRQGEMTAILGKGGTGKTALMNMIGGLSSMDEGDYFFKGKKLNFSNQTEIDMFRRNHVGFLVRQFGLIPGYNIFENIALPLQYLGYSGSEIQSRVKHALLELDIQDIKKQYPCELPDRQKQLAAIARIIASDPDIILADEPTGSLDEETESNILDILKKLNQDGKTIVLATHDPKVAAACPRVVLLCEGKIFEE